MTRFGVTETLDPNLSSKGRERARVKVGVMDRDRDKDRDRVIVRDSVSG